jgi:hypothetical protein
MAIFFSLNEVRAALGRQEQREQEMVQERLDIAIRDRDRTLANIQDQQEVQKRRDDGATTRTARQTAEAWKKTQTTMRTRQKGLKSRPNSKLKLGRKGEREKKIVKGLKAVSEAQP